MLIYNSFLSCGCLKVKVQANIQFIICYVAELRPVPLVMISICLQFLKHMKQQSGLDTYTGLNSHWYIPEHRLQSFLSRSVPLVIISICLQFRKHMKQQSGLNTYTGLNSHWYIPGRRLQSFQSRLVRNAPAQAAREGFRLVRRNSTVQYQGWSKMFKWFTIGAICIQTAVPKDLRNEYCVLNLTLKICQKIQELPIIFQF